jgi:hypothetical protein
MMDIVQKYNSFNTNTPSSESYRKCAVSAYNELKTLLQKGNNSKIGNNVLAANNVDYISLYRDVLISIFPKYGVTSLMQQSLQMLF